MQYFKLILLFVALCTSLQAQQANNYSLQFDGIDDYVEIADPVGGELDFGLTESFSVAAWVKVPQYTSSEVGLALISKRAAPNGAHIEGYQLIIDNPGKGYFVVEDQFGQYNNNHGNLEFDDGDWHYLTGVRDVGSDSVYLYIDGILDRAIPDLCGTSLESSEPIWIARWPFYGRYYNSNIDEVSIWNTALSQQEIVNYMDCPLSGTENGLVGYWPFEEGQGTNTSDASLNNNAGTLIQGPSWSTDVPPQGCLLGTDATYLMEVSLSPNPVFNGRLEVELGHSSIEEKWRFEVWDVMGRKHLDLPLNGTGKTSLALGEIESGVYLFRITNPSCDIGYSGRMVVQ